MDRPPRSSVSEVPSGASAWIIALVELAGSVERAVAGVASRATEVPAWRGVAASEYRDAHAGLVRRWESWVEDLRKVARAADVWTTDPEAGWPAFRAAMQALEHGSEPEVVRVQWDLPLPGTPVTVVEAWWNGLSPQDRMLTEALAGTGLGALGGIPLAVRDRVNRVTLRHDLAVDRRSVPVKRALARRDGARTWLLSYDRDAHDGDGRVAVGIGDLESDHRLAVLVPGVGTQSEDVVRGVRQARALRQEAGPGTAAVWWLGYDAPDGVADPSMFTTGRAYDGGRALVDHLAGLRVARDGLHERVTLVGHSYGAVTVAAALGRDVPDLVDAAVLVGAPGAAGAQSVDDLSATDVYALRDSRDAVGLLGKEGRIAGGHLIPGVGLGVDPASEEFGAVRLGAERADRGRLPGVGEPHTSYFEPGSESLRGVGAVVRGGEAVMGAAEPAEDAWWGPPRDPEYGRVVR